MILTGDLNVSHDKIDVYEHRGQKKRGGYTPQERESFSKLLDSGFIDTFRHLHPEKVQYSVWKNRFRMREKNRGWRSDYFLMSKDFEEH